MPQNIHHVNIIYIKNLIMQPRLNFHKLIQSPHKSSAYGHINEEESLQEYGHIPLCNDVYIPEDVYESS